MIEGLNMALLKTLLTKFEGSSQIHLERLKEIVENVVDVRTISTFPEVET